MSIGTIFDIQRLCVHDGPGIRTTVFLKGCNIRCEWCHNPESLNPRPQLSLDHKNCVFCGSCAKVCPQGAHVFEILPDGTQHHRVDRTKCVACGKCVDECLFNALKIWGRPMTPEDVMKEVVKDRIYYESSGGGLTVSGGEPSVQFEFLRDLLTLAKAEGLNTCIESNGIMSEERLRELMPLVDLFLIDFKAVPGEMHKALTGNDGHQVLRTLEILGEAGHPLVLRCPTIQGLNDTDERFAGIAELLDKYPNIDHFEIMAYHSLGKGKWDQLDQEYALFELPDATPEMKQQWIEAVEAHRKG